MLKTAKPQNSPQPAAHKTNLVWVVAVLDNVQIETIIETTIQGNPTKNYHSTVGHLFRWNYFAPTLRFVPLGGARGRIHAMVASADIFSPEFSQTVSRSSQEEGKESFMRINPHKMKNAY